MKEFIKTKNQNNEDVVEITETVVSQRRLPEIQFEIDMIQSQIDNLEAKKAELEDYLK